MPFLEHVKSVGGLDAAFAVPTTVTIIVVCSLLGIIWAVLNYVSIRSIDLEYPATQPLGITQEQHIRLLDLGDKIATVRK